MKPPFATGGLPLSEFYPAPTRGADALLISLHGLGDSAAGYRFLPGALGIPRLNHLLANAPDEYYGGYSWYDYAGDPEPGVRRSRELLERLLDAAQAAGFPSSRTFLFGFSQGCLMTLETGARHARLLAGLAGISGYVWSVERLLAEMSPAAREQRILITHGTRDPLLPLSLVQPQIDSLRQAGLKIDWRVFNKEHTILAEELSLLKQFIVEGLPDLA